MLRLTKKADYSLIALRHFASKHNLAGRNQSLSAKELSESSGIPLPLLSKLLQKLGKTGFLVSECGTNGGYRLAREPREISALQVIRAIDGPIVLANCFTADSFCGHASRCTIRRPLRRIHEGILRLLDSVSIQDMCRIRRRADNDLLVSARFSQSCKIYADTGPAASAGEGMSLLPAAGALHLRTAGFFEENEFMKLPIYMDNHATTPMDPRVFRRHEAVLPGDLRKRRFAQSQLRLGSGRSYRKSAQADCRSDRRNAQGNCFHQRRHRIEQSRA